MISEPIIHHFRCAHVGPESDYKEGYDLICPKCDRQLRHIGIDYDKLSEIVHCGVCNHHTQDPLMEASCVDCGSTMGLGHIQTIDIKEYELSLSGESLAIQGYYEATEEKEVLPTGVINPDLFSLLVTQELERIKIRHHSSFLIKISLITENLSFLSIKNQREIALECLEVVTKYFRNLDSLSISNDSAIWVLMPELDESSATNITKLAFNNLQLLLHDNIGIEEPLIQLELLPVQAPLPVISK